MMFRPVGRKVVLANTAVRPHTSPKGAPVPAQRVQSRGGRGTAYGRTRPSLHRQSRSKTWKMKMMADYMNRDLHQEEKPYVKFQRACKSVRVIASICLLLKKYAEKEKQKERSFLETNLTIQDEIRREIAFDINQYKCHRGLRHLGGERLKRMLSAPREKRDLNVIMALLRGNEEFQKYPKETQLEICKCAVFQRYGARRVIVREGHKPEAFYIMVSGHVLINMIDVNPRTGVKFTSTVNEIEGGASFGERSLLSNSNRTSTVVCKTDVELLAIMSEEFMVCLSFVLCGSEIPFSAQAFARPNRL